MSSEIIFRVRAHRPTPWGCNEWQWRAAVAAAAREANAAMPIVPPPPGAQFSANLLFHLQLPSFEHADLDNLAKPVLDTIFLSRYAQVADRALTGAVFGVDDDRIVRLVVEKRSVGTSQEEGVDVSVAW